MEHLPAKIFQETMNKIINKQNSNMNKASMAIAVKKLRRVLNSLDKFTSSRDFEIYR